MGNPIKENKKYITIQFKSSRIGYLCRRPPAYGIIIIYDDSNSTIYYDYVENIYFRLNNFHDSEKWKDINKPSIHVPIENKLTAHVIHEVHSRFVQRHENNQTLLSFHGVKFGIPVFEKNIKLDKYETKEGIIDFLEKYGLEIFEYNEIRHLKGLIDQLTLPEILHSDRITVLSAIINCEIGNYIESEFFLKKCTLIKNTILEDVINFTQLKTDFALGYSNNREHLSRLEKMSNKVNHELNKITIAINIVYFKTLISLDEKRFDAEIIKEIETVFETILNSGIKDEEKYKSLNANAINLEAFSTSLFIEKVTAFQIRENLNFETSLHSKKSDVLLISYFLDLPRKYTLKSLKYAEENNNVYLKASSHSQLSHYFFTLHFNYFLLDMNPQLSVDLKKQYKLNLSNAIHGFNEFSELHLIKNAYNSLVISIEILQLFKSVYSQDLDFIKIDEIEQKMKLIQKELNLPNYKSIVLKAQDKKSKPIDYEALINVSNEELAIMADRINSSLGLPESRKVNILTDLKNSKFFYNNRKSSNFQILQDLTHTKSFKTYYKESPKQIIKCLDCDYETSSSENISEIIEEINNHKCKKRL